MDTFEALETYAETSPKTLALVERIVETGLGLDSENSYYRIFRSNGGRWGGVALESAEFREPRTDESNGRTILLLRLEETNGTTLHDVRQSYGDGFELVPRSPTAPSEIPMGYRYRIPNGEITFGIAVRGQETSLRTILVDAT